MPRLCSCCDSAHRAAIDAAIRAGTPSRRVAKRFGLSRGSVVRHAKNHLAPPDPATVSLPAESKTVSREIPDLEPKQDSTASERPAELEHRVLFGLEIEDWRREGSRQQFLIVHASDPADPWWIVEVVFNPTEREPFVRRFTRTAAELAELRTQYEDRGDEFPPRMWRRNTY